LVRKQVPVYCCSLDEAFLRKRGIKSIPLEINQRNEFLTGIITPFPAKHGYGIIGKLMGHGSGYFIELPGDKTIYISGDTVMNQTVRHVLNDLRPDISILNAGTATLDLGRPILMPLNEILDFIKAAPGKVVAVHLDVFNHCLTTRSMLRDAVSKEGLSSRVMIPEDGELMEF
jgi:L-ascorbate metabolism protein UlaG (beta-lactamase superfamily)